MPTVVMTVFGMFSARAMVSDMPVAVACKERFTRIFLTAVLPARIFSKAWSLLR